MFANCPFDIIGEPEFVYHGKWLKTRRVRFRKPGTQIEQVPLIDFFPVKKKRLISEDRIWYSLSWRKDGIVLGINKNAGQYARIKAKAFVKAHGF